MKLCFVFVLVFAGTALGTIEKRIIKGQPCDKTRQYHVQIKSNQGTTSCGGSLLNKRWVITASHCAERIVNLVLGVNYKKSFIKNIFSKKEEQQIPIEQQFTFKEGDNPHDIMLIKLNKDASDKLPTIELPPPGCTRPQANEQVKVGGWGSVEEPKHKIPSKLMCATTKMDVCRENDKPGSKYQSDETTTMCAFTAGVKSCYVRKLFS